MDQVADSCPEHAPVSTSTAHGMRVNPAPSWQTITERTRTSASDRRHRGRTRHERYAVELGDVNWLLARRSDGGSLRVELASAGASINFFMSTALVILPKSGETMFVVGLLRFT